MFIELELTKHKYFERSGSQLWEGREKYKVCNWELVLPGCLRYHVDIKGYDIPGNFKNSGKAHGVMEKSEASF